MSPLKMGSKKVRPITTEELSGRSTALGQALETGGAELDPLQVREAAAVIDKIRERTSKTGGHTVVALAGATGSGKSSLFNALVGSTVAVVGARRPTTARPIAAVWGDEDATELLDWLSVAGRHHVDAAGEPDKGSGAVGSLDGLVLLDLPDFDSRVSSHREEAERVLALVDVFVWVTDPQKYADARLHDDYLRALSTHDTVTVVVLNQSDRLTGDQLAQVRSDLARLTRPPRWPARTPHATGWPPTSARPPDACVPGCPTASPRCPTRPTTSSSTRWPGPQGCPRWLLRSNATTATRRGGAPAGRSPAGCGPCDPTRSNGCG
jgi:energy-coupling factor transporter ATP-binding protein EcfA2